LKKKTKKLLVQNKFFLSVGPMKSLFSFLTAQTEKNLWKKNGVNKIDGLMSQKKIHGGSKIPKIWFKNCLILKGEHLLLIFVLIRSTFETINFLKMGLVFFVKMGLCSDPFCDCHIAIREMNKSIIEIYQNHHIRKIKKY